MKSKSNKILTGILVITAVAGLGSAGAYAINSDALAEEAKGNLEGPRFCMNEDKEEVSLTGTITAIDGPIITVKDDATGEEYSFPVGMPKEDVEYEIGQEVAFEGFAIDAEDHPKFEDKGVNFIAMSLDGEELKKPRKMHKGDMQNLTDEEREELKTMREQMRKSMSAEDQARMQELHQKMRSGDGAGSQNNE
ncbi:hypothetical protein ACFL1U_03160 [Patescibacteria group bacterium]